MSENSKGKDFETSIEKYKKHTHNPFLEGFQPPQSASKQWTKTEGGEVVDPETGEVFTSWITQTTITYKDSERFIKLYHKKLNETFDLSTTGSRVLGYLMSITPKDDDEVEIDIKKCMENLKFASRTSVYIAICELLHRKFIARARGNLFYINVDMFFNGDRLVVINDYRVKAGLPEISKKASNETKGISSKGRKGMKPNPNIKKDKRK